MTFIALSASTLAVAKPADSIVQAVDNAHRVAWPTRPARWVTPQNDAGAVPDDVPLKRLALALRRSPERQQAWEALLRAQHDPASADYHHWLTPTEIGERFGATQHDIDTLSDWLSAQGLHVDGVSNSRTRVTFSGSAAEVAAAFSAPLHYYRVGKEKRISNITAPALPAAFAEAVQSVIGLHSVTFRPLHRLSEPREASWLPGSPRPASTNCSDSGCEHYLFPADFAKIYHLDATTAQGNDGSGQTIAIVGRTRVYEPDVANFQARAGLPTKYPAVTVPPGGVDPGAPASTCSDTGTPSCDDPDDAVGDQFEATLDVERAGSVAPGAAIDLIVADDTSTVSGLQLAVEYAIDTTPVPAQILSISYLTCEADNGSVVVHSMDEMFQQAAAEGISVFVASGDSGAAGCADQTVAPLPGQTPGINALCSSGYVTCVGGTQFNDSADPLAYWSLHDGVGHLSALGYIPEGAWNEPLDASGATQLAASGGGTSLYVGKPAWQVGAGVPDTQGRDIPDMSLSASSHDGYFACMAAQKGSCDVAGGRFHFLVASGTSAAAPSMAGIAALLNQKTGAAQGNLNPRLYALAATPGNEVFHDVTVASSGVGDCNVAVPSLCNNSTPGPDGLSGGLAGYAVGPGYDLATGLGSIDAGNLLAQWDHATPSWVNLDQHGLTGAWYNPATSGQGLVLEISRDASGPGVGTLFGGWFTFDTSVAGGQRWYSIQGDVAASAPSATLPIYLSQGGRFDAPANVSTLAVGEATLSFADCLHGTLAYAFNDGSGRSGSMPLTRLTTNPTCAPEGDLATPASSSALSGAWYEPATSGQGFVFDFGAQQNVLFGAWYTFAPNASPSAGPVAQRWYVLQGTIGSDVHTNADIPIYQTRGGRFDQSDPVQTTPVGLATLTVHGCTAATLTYLFTGGENFQRNGSIELIRLLPPVSGCSY